MQFFQKNGAQTRAELVRPHTWVHDMNKEINEKPMIHGSSQK